MVKEDLNFNLGRIDAIQALRALAALAVVIGHTAIFQRGTFGVDIFFIVSGFIMMYVTQSQSQSKHFFIKRLIRIVPLYWLITIIRFLLSPSVIYNQTYNWDLFWESMFFLPDFKFRHLQPLFNIGWTLNHEMIFYILFAVACFISIRHRFAIAASLVAGWAFAINYFDMPYDNPTLPLEFIFGMLAFEIIKRGYNLNEDLEDKRARNALCIILCAISLWFLVSPLAMRIIYYSGDLKFWRPIFFGFAAMIFVAGFCLFMKDKKTPKVLNFLGNISFSLYLWHVFVIAFLKLILNNLNIIGNNHDYYEITVQNFVFMFVALIISVGISTVSYYLIEVKFTNLLKKIIIKK